MNKLILVPVFLTLIALIFTPTINAQITQRDNEAKEEIFDELSKTPYSNYKTIIAETHDNKTLVIYNQSEAPPPPPPTCPADTMWNETSKTCVPIPPMPPVCPPNQFYNTTTQQCQDLPVIPPPPPPPVDTKPNPNFNQTVWMRVAAVADIDNNAGLVTQLNLAKKYNAQVLIIPGDYGYNSCSGVIDKLKAAGFTGNNAIIIQGNHDCSANTKAFNGMSSLYGVKNFGKLAVFALDGNTGLSCSSTQFNTMRPQIEASNAMYEIAAIHQQFVTGPSDHGTNGQFACWDPLFRANGVEMVLQGHNHNYQRFDVNGVTYETVGTGTHDTGNNMYPIKSDAQWNGFDCQKCFTGTNGIALIDLQIDNPQVKNIHGWFISNADTVKDSFN